MKNLLGKKAKFVNGLNVEISNDNQTESKVYSDDEQKIVSYVSNMLGVSEEKIEIYTVS